MQRCVVGWAPVPKAKPGSKIILISFGLFILCHDGTILILSLIQIGLNWDCDNFTQSVSETDEAVN